MMAPLRKRPDPNVAALPMRGEEHNRVSMHAVWVNGSQVILCILTELLVICFFAIAQDRL